MITDRDDGGAAFPRSDGGYSRTEDGMTLRDWFAGHAMAVYVSRGHIVHDDQIAKAAYIIADAMLAERAK